MSKATISLFITHPHLKDEWNFDLNLIDPLKVTYGSAKKNWWKCLKCNSSYEASINNKTIHNSKCPYCYGRKVNNTNSLLTKYPDIALEWSAKNELASSEFTYGSSKLAWWKCKRCKSEYQQTIGKRTTANLNCPFCNGFKINETNSLINLYPNICKEWDYVKNNISPSEITVGSSKKIWWKCLKCDSSYKQTVYSKVHLKYGCSYCSGKLTNKTNSLESKCIKLLSQWNYKKNITLPSQVTPSSMKIVWWICEFGHEWEISINSRRYGKTPCPYCNNCKVSAENNLAIVNPELSKEWHFAKNKDLLPNQVTFSSLKKVWWICKNNHEWLTSVYDRNIAGYNCKKCSKCVSKGEIEWLNYLGIHEDFRQYKIKVNKQWSIRADGYDPKTKTLYEYNGDFWHGNPKVYDLTKINIFSKKTFGELYQNTLDREKLIKEAGYNLISIWENDWKFLQKGLI